MQRHADMQGKEQFQVAYRRPAPVATCVVWVLAPFAAMTSRTQAVTVIGMWSRRGFYSGSHVRYSPSGTVFLTALARLASAAHKAFSVTLSWPDLRLQRSRSFAAAEMHYGQDGTQKYGLSEIWKLWDSTFGTASTDRGSTPALSYHFDGPQTAGLQANEVGYAKNESHPTFYTGMARAS